MKNSFDFSKLTLNIEFLRNFKHTKTIVKIFIFAFLVLYLYVLFMPRETIYTISGETEHMEIEFAQDIINEWDVSKGLLITNILIDDSITLPEDSYLFVDNLTNVQISINEKSKSTYTLVLSLNNKNGSIGVIEAPDNIIELSSYAEISLPINNSFILPFHGKVYLGNDVGRGVNNILLNGNVRIIEEQLLKDGRYIGGDFPLDIGDRVELFVDSQMSEISKVKGFMKITDNKYYEFIVHGEGDKVKVERLGSSGYEISPSFWYRITNDPIVAALSSVIAILFLLMEFSSLLFNYIKKEQ
jgi:hypothetical protein